MAVYVIPRNRNNIWWGGGRGGGSGILDLLGQALIQPMLQRDALARQFNYQQRLEADDRAYRMGILDRIARGIDARGDMPVGAGDTIAGLVGAGANLKDFQGYYVPQVTTTDYGDRKEIRSVNQWDTDPIVGAVGLSPKEAEDVALAKRGADLAERQFADASALEWYVARQNAAIAANNARGGGKAADPYAGLNAWGNFAKALGLGNGSGEGGIPTFSIGADGNPVISGSPNTAAGPAEGIWPLVWNGVGQEFARLYGFNPFPSEAQPQVAPNPEMDSDVGMITPQPTNDRGVNDMRYNMQLGMNPRGWNRMPVSPGMTQPSAAMVRQHALNRGISDEDALRELTQQ